MKWNCCLKWRCVEVLREVELFEMELVCEVGVFLKWGRCV